MDSSWQVWLWVKVSQEKNNLKKNHFFPPPPPLHLQLSLKEACCSWGEVFLSPGGTTSLSQLQRRARPGQGHPRWAPAEDLTGPCPLCLAEDIPNPLGPILGQTTKKSKRRRGVERKAGRESQIKEHTLGSSTFNTWPLSGRWIAIEIHPEFHELIEWIKYGWLAEEMKGCCFLLLCYRVLIFVD